MGLAANAIQASNGSLHSIEGPSQSLLNATEPSPSLNDPDDPFKSISDRQAAAQKLIDEMNAPPIPKPNPEWESVLKAAALAKGSLGSSQAKHTHLEEYQDHAAYSDPFL